MACLLIFFWNMILLTLIRNISVYQISTPDYTMSAYLRFLNTFCCLLYYCGVVKDFLCHSALADSCVVSIKLQSSLIYLLQSESIFIFLLPLRTIFSSFRSKDPSQQLYFFFSSSICFLIKTIRLVGLSLQGIYFCLPLDFSKLCSLQMFSSIMYCVHDSFIYIEKIHVLIYRQTVCVPININKNINERFEADHNP